MKMLTSMCAGAFLLVAGASLGHAQTGTLKHNQGWTYTLPGNVSLWTNGSILGLTGGNGRLGAQVQPMTDPLRAYFGAPAGSGVLVTDVAKGSPAASAGLRTGDVIVSVDGKPVGSAWEILRELAPRSAGAQVKVEIVRDKKRKTITATLRTQSFGGMHPKGLSNLRSALKGLKRLDALKHFNIQIPDVDANLPAARSKHNRALRKQLRATQKRVRELERRLQALEKKTR